MSVTVGTKTSIQIGLDERGLKKLHSFLVAAEAACSSGDLPVVAVEAMLVAVIGLATAAEAAVVPTVLPAATLVVPSAAMGAAHPCIRVKAMNKATQEVLMGEAKFIY
mgnify:CR=1 FL=1